MIVEPGKLKEKLAPKARLMALDVGEKTIGLALSDTRLTIASPFETIRRRKFTADAAALMEKAREQGAGALVIGLPLNMDGSEGKRCQSTREFARNLEKLTDLPIAFWDERLSTMAVTRTLLEADASRKRRKQVVDKMAAAYILQGLLDWLARKS